MGDDWFHLLRSLWLLFGCPNKMKPFFWKTVLKKKKKKEKEKEKEKKKKRIRIIKILQSDQQVERGLYSSNKS